MRKALRFRIDEAWGDVDTDVKQATPLAQSDSVVEAMEDALERASAPGSRTAAARVGVVVALARIVRWTLRWAAGRVKGNKQAPNGIERGNQ